MRKFEDLAEREAFAPAMSLEEEGERVDSDFAEGLRQAGAAAVIAKAVE
jgi:hypothetical protein